MPRYKGPPGKRRVGPREEAATNVATDTTRLADRSDVAALPRLTGCPCGCSNPDECVLAEPISTSCGACGALSLPERESLVTCWSVCPERTRAAS
jgi:hypothetical protein